MTKTEWTKDSALQWFLSELLKQFAADQPAKFRAFDAAWEARGSGALKQKWEAWCRRVLKKTRDCASTNPPGFMIQCFRNGPDRPLSEEDDAGTQGTPRDWQEEQAAYMRSLRKEAEALPEERPSLEKCVDLRRSGGQAAVDEYLAPFRKAEQEVSE